MGIIAAGSFKLLIPFLCIVPGMAAAHILKLDPLTESDKAFAGLTRALVPAGYGLVGLVMAGLVGAILSTIDSTWQPARWPCVGTFAKDGSRGQKWVFGRRSLSDRRAEVVCPLIRPLDSHRNNFRP